jgi:hypothetical protein
MTQLSLVVVVVAGVVVIAEGAPREGAGVVVVAEGLPKEGVGVATAPRGTG